MLFLTTYGGSVFYGLPQDPNASDDIDKTWPEGMGVTMVRTRDVIVKICYNSFNTLIQQLLSPDKNFYSISELPAIQPLLFPLSSFR